MTLFFRDLSFRGKTLLGNRLLRRGAQWKTVLAILLTYCAFGTARGQTTAAPNSPPAQVTPDQPDEQPPTDAAKDEKAKTSPAPLVSDSIARLSQLRQEAAELAAQIEDFQREAAQLQKRGQRLQGKLVSAEREALEKAGLDPDKYALDDGFKPVKRQVQPQAQRGPGRPNKPEGQKAPENKKQ